VSPFFEFDLPEGWRVEGAWPQFAARGPGGEELIIVGRAPGTLASMVAGVEVILAEPDVIVRRPWETAEPQPGMRRLRVAAQHGEGRTFEAVIWCSGTAVMLATLDCQAPSEAFEAYVASVRPTTA
jgi:hypothetical protein